MFPPWRYSWWSNSWAAPAPEDRSDSGLVLGLGESLNCSVQLVTKQEGWKTCRWQLQGKKGKNLWWDLFRILSLLFIRQVGRKPRRCCRELSTVFRTPHKSLCVPLIGILCVASTGIYLSRVMRVESQFLAHLTIQPPLSLESTGGKISGSIFIITKTSTAGDNKVVFLRRIWMTSITVSEASHSGKREVWEYCRAINCAWLVIFNKTRWENAFLFPLGNTSSKACKISVPPSGLSLEQNKGTSWRKQELIFWVYLGCFLLKEQFILMPSAESKEPGEGAQRRYPPCAGGETEAHNGKGSRENHGFCSHYSGKRQEMQWVPDVVNPSPSKGRILSQSRFAPEAKSKLKFDLRYKWSSHD